MKKRIKKQEKKIALIGILCGLAVITLCLIERPRNILVLGIDKRGSIENESGKVGDNGQADYIMVVHIEPLRRVCRVISIPRETMADVTVKASFGNGEMMQNEQICLQYAYGRSAKEGCTLMAQCIENNFGIKIDNYAAFSMEAIVKVIDALGGVDVTMSKDYLVPTKDWTDWISYKEGETVHLSGEESYEFVHYRDIYQYYSNQERMVRQCDFLNGFRDSALQMVKRRPMQIVEIYHQINEDKETDCSVFAIVGLIQSYLSWDSEEELFEKPDGKEQHEGFYDQYIISEQGKEKIKQVCE